jgi:stearoyl-CoA desaturase (delta-9 desaturase)
MKYFSFVYIPALLLGMLCFGIMWYHSDWWWLLATLMFWVLLSGLGIAVGFHRIYSHQCFTNLKPWLDNLLLVCGSLAGQGSSLSWVAIHRGYHHRYSDTYKDPHTPVLKGFFYAVGGWTKNVNEDTINHKYAGSLLKKPTHVFVHRYYIRLLYSFMFVFAALDWLLFGDLHLFAYGYCVALMIAVLQDNLVNYFGHAPRFGYKNFSFEEIKDESTNFWPLGYFGWGQGWHQNHHMYPERFSFRYRWWEFDPCVIFIPLLKLGGIGRK